ncbi:MAG: 3-oxoacyl-ACP reductase FabG [Oscillospiraceae bacterium]|nr:3-oxoacyl-ACP reductase FabG [Oscillospiraceae bacterium]
MKTALITGGAGGIGSEIVRVLCADGYAAAINYNKSENEALRLLAELEFLNYSVIAVKCDIRDSCEVARMFLDVKNRLGPVSLLVNNAGVAQKKLFQDITDDDFKNMLDVNLTGAFYCCRAALPDMIKAKRGKIINVSSVFGQSGGSCEAHYSAAKAGLIGLTKALALETAPSGISVNCVAPGAVKTGMLSYLDETDMAGIENGIPAGRFGTPRDVAEAVKFLASPSADYITGQVLAVNGGGYL